MRHIKNMSCEERCRSFRRRRDWTTDCGLSIRRATLKPLLRDHWKPSLLGGVLGIATYGLALYALSLGAVVEIAALRETMRDIRGRHRRVDSARTVRQVARVGGGYRGRWRYSDAGEPANAALRNMEGTRTISPPV